MAEETTKFNAEDMKKDWRGRDGVIAADRQILKLTSSGKTQEGYEEVIMNEPKVLYETAVSMLSAVKPKFVIPMKAKIEPEEKLLIGKAERFLSGLFRLLDYQSMLSGEGQWLRQLAYWVCSGWSATFPYIDKDGMFHAVQYDPITIYPQWVEGRLTGLLREVNISKIEALNILLSLKLAPPEELGNEVILQNYWVHREDGVWNTILFNGEEVKPETKEAFDEIPFVIGLANGCPEKNQSDWRNFIGQNIIATNKEMYKQQNRWISMMMDIVANTAYPPIQTETPTGEGIIGKGDLSSGTILPTRTGEKISPIQYAGTPIEVNTINSILSGNIQRGGLAYVIYGGLPFELSGFALSQMMASVRYKMSPYIVTMEQVLSRLGLEFLNMFRKHGKDIELAIPEKGHGKFFLESFTKTDIPKITRVEAVLDIDSQQDKMQQILAARQALTPPALMSRETLWADYLDIDDPILEKQMIGEDMVEALPMYQAIRAIDGLRNEAIIMHRAGNTEGARALMGYAQVMLNQVMQQASGQQGAAPQDGAGKTQGQAGQGFRTGQTSPEERAAAQGRMNR